MSGKAISGRNFGYCVPKGVALVDVFFNRKGERYRLGAVIRRGDALHSVVARCPASKSRRRALKMLRCELAGMVREMAP